MAMAVVLMPTATLLLRSLCLPSSWSTHKLTKHSSPSLFRHSQKAASKSAAAAAASASADAADAAASQPKNLQNFDDLLAGMQKMAMAAKN